MVAGSLKLLKPKKQKIHVSKIKMLCFDIQVEIIKKLPVKSLIQFRSVCKAWKSLIDSSHFIVGYNNRHDLPQHLVVSYEFGRYGEELDVKYVSFVEDDNFSQEKFDLTVPPIVQATTIIDGSHGLLCLIGYLEDTKETSIAVLWNPAIRKSIVVPIPNVIHRPFGSSLGFAVCPFTKDPKLVNITYIYDDRKIESTSCIPFQVMVFTLSSGEWRTSSCSNLPRKSIGFTCSVAVIGQFIYWLAYDRVADDGSLIFHNLIMSFDLNTEEFREIDLPDSLAEQPESDLAVYRLRESLVVVEYDSVFEDLTSKGVCFVWMMEDGDSKAFTKLFTINLPNASVSKTLGFRNSGEPIVEMCDHYRDYKTPCSLVVYEPWSKKIKDLGIRGTRCSFWMGSYTESLVLLDHEDGRVIRCGAVKN